MSFDKIYKKNPYKTSNNGDLSIPYNQPECTTPKKWYFEILDRKKKWHNLLDICGIDLTAPENMELNYPKNNFNTFKFTYTVELGQFKEPDLSYNFSDYKSEIKITEDNVVIFSGYVENIDSLIPVNDSGYAKLQANVVGTEKVYFRQNLYEKTSWYNKKSKDILAELNEIVKSKITHGFPDWDIHPNLNNVFQDSIQHSGQFSRLFDIIKNKEKATFGFYPHGKVKFIRDSDFGAGADITNDVFGTGISNIDIKVDNNNYANQVVFIAKDIKGGLQKENVRFVEKPAKNSNQKKFSGTVPTAYQIYKIRRMETFGSGVHHSDWIYDPSYRDNETDDKWRYDFNGNTVNLSIESSVISVDVEYWKAESGVYIVDFEKKVIEEFDIRELTSQHFVHEITNERVKSIGDMLEYMKQVLDFRQYDQGAIKLTLEQGNINHTLASEHQDFNVYPFKLTKLVPEFVDGTSDTFVNKVTPILETTNEDATFNNKLFVKSKTYKLNIHGRDEKDSNDNSYISNDRFKINVEMETDKSHDPEKIFLRDKHEWQRSTQTQTINLVKHIEWDLTTGACTDKGQLPYTTNNFTDDVTPNVMDKNPVGRLHLVDKVQQSVKINQSKLDKTPSSSTDPDKDSPKCFNDSRQQGVVFVEMNLPKQPELKGLYEYVYYPNADAGMTEEKLGKWLTTHFKDNLGNPTYGVKTQYYVYVPNSGWWGMKINPQYNPNLPEGILNKKWDKSTVEKQNKWHPIKVILEIVDKGTTTGATAWSDNLEFHVFIPNRIAPAQTDMWLDPKTNQVIYTPIIPNSPDSFKITFADFSNKIAFLRADGSYNYWINWKHSNPNRAIQGDKCADFKIREGYKHLYPRSSSTFTDQMSLNPNDRLPTVATSGDPYIKV